MPATVRPAAAPATEPVLAALAERLGGPLPAGYRHFLQTANGGKPEPAAFEAIGFGWSSVTRFHSAGTGDDYSIERVAELTAFHNLPPRTLPIGEDPGGNLLLLNRDGAIILFAYCGWPLREPEPALILVGPDFDGFLALLRPAETVPADAWALDHARINVDAGHPEWGRDPAPGYHWHYDEPTRAAQLVPRDIHWMAPHVSSTRS